MSDTPDLDEDLEPTLAAYEKEKWAQLSDDGPEGLGRELAGLKRFLAEADDHDWASQRLIAFRQAKARVLSKILDEAEG